MSDDYNEDELNRILDEESSEEEDSIEKVNTDNILDSVLMHAETPTRANPRQRSFFDG